MNLYRSPPDFSKSIVRENQIALVPPRANTTSVS